MQPIAPATKNDSAAAEAAAEAAAAAETQLGSSSVLTEFSPEAHSWILVPTHEDAPASPTTGGVSLVLAELGAAVDTASQISAAEAVDDAPAAEPAAPSTVLLPAPNETSSPCMLREVDSPEGEAVAALAVSELLDPRFMATQLAPPPTPPLSDSDASCDTPASLLTSSCEARKLGALAFPPRLLFASSNEPSGKRQSAAEGDESPDVDTDDDDDDDDDALDALAAFGRAWAKPIAIVAVLIASHAVVLMIGVHLGKQMTPQPRNDVYLTRRFSSGASGAHARLCMA